jgi:hypothetical protein
VISIGDGDNVQAVLPYCVLAWYVFLLDDDLYLSARTQAPLPPGQEVMNPEWTDWLFSVGTTNLTRIWPARR